MGPSGGLGQALLGGWAKLATCSCGGPAASGSGNSTATPPTLTTHPWPPFPFDAHGWPFAGCGCCCGLAIVAAPAAIPHPAGQCRLESWPSGQRHPSHGGLELEQGGGEGGVAGSPLRPRQLRPAVALPAPTLPPHQLPLPGRG